VDAGGKVEGYDVVPSFFLFRGKGFALAQWWEVGVRDKRTGVQTAYLAVWKRFWRHGTTVNEMTSKVRVYYVLLQTLNVEEIISARTSTSLAPAYLLVLAEIISSTLKMEAIFSSETSVATQQTTRRHIPDDDTLQWK
jgi:hypothetical protein